MYHNKTYHLPHRLHHRLEVRAFCRGLTQVLEYMIVALRSARSECLFDGICCLLFTGHICGPV